MAKRNVVLRLDEEVVREIRQLAARRGTTVSALVAEQIGVIARRESRRRFWNRALTYRP